MNPTKGLTMQFYVKFKVFDTINSQEDVRQLRAAFGETIQKIMNTGKVVSSGIFADSREGFFILENVNSADEMMNLFGSGLLDHCNVETHPYTSFEKLGELFQKEAG
jgi:hypothetical protein